EPTGRGRDRPGAGPAPARGPAPRPRRPSAEPARRGLGQRDVPAWAALPGEASPPPARRRPRDARAPVAAGHRASGGSPRSGAGPPWPAHGILPLVLVGHAVGRGSTGGRQRRGRPGPVGRQARAVRGTAAPTGATRSAPQPAPRGPAQGP